MKPVKRDMSFAEILGKKREEYSESARRERWEAWKRLAKENGDKEVIKYWSDTSACIGCIHLDKKQAWCNSQGLPCTVNPVLSFTYGMSGMACMGAGKESVNQAELFE